MASVILAENDTACAVNLLAASIAIVESTGYKIESELQDPYDRADKLSGIDFRSAWKEGLGLTVEDVVRLALKE